MHPSANGDMRDECFSLLRFVTQVALGNGLCQVVFRYPHPAVCDFWRNLDEQSVQQRN